MNAMGFGVGLIPEQVWDRPDLGRSPFGTDPTSASIGFTNGEAAAMKSIVASCGAGLISISVGGGFLLNMPHPATPSIRTNTNHVRMMPGMQHPTLTPDISSYWPGASTPGSVADNFEQPILEPVPFVHGQDLCRILDRLYERPQA